MKKVYIILIVFLAGYLLFCAGCMKFRMSDGKAYASFAKQQIPLQLLDSSFQHHRIHYAISGDATLPTLVFIHGSPGSWSNYTEYLMDSSLRQKFRMMSIDRPGFGYSDFGTPMHLKAQSELLIRTIAAHQNGKDVYLAGHSIGGPVVAQMAAMSPGSFKKIVILSGSISPYLEPKEQWRNLLDNTIMKRLLPGAFAPSNTEIRWFKKDLYELEKEMPDITSGIIFIHGDKDKWVPIENVDYGVKRMQHAASIQIDTMPGEAHFIPWTRFKEIKSILMKLY